MYYYYVPKPKFEKRRMIIMTIICFLLQLIELIIEKTNIFTCCVKDNLKSFDITNIY